MKKQKFYAVRKGRKTGIFKNWSDTQKQVHGYPGAQFKSFLNLKDAKEYVSLNLFNANLSTNKEITVYTDGGSRNTGIHANQHVKSTDKAAWAYFIKIKDRKYQGTGGELGATNNRMEIMAVLKALTWLIDHHYSKTSIQFISDSSYVLNAITMGWLNGWKKRGWKLSNNKPVKNASLWKRVSNILPKFSQLNFKWTKGHAKNQGNNFVDHLLNQTMDQMTSKKQKFQENNIQRNNVRKNYHSTHKLKNHHEVQISDNSVDSIKQSLKDQGFFLD